MEDDNQANLLILCVQLTIITCMKRPIIYLFPGQLADVPGNRNIEEGVEHNESKAF